MSLEHALPLHAVLAAITVAIILYAILTARSGKDYYVRKIPGLAAIDEAVGRATEMGRPMLFSIGLGGTDPSTFQALAVLQHVARLAARYDGRLIVPIVDVVLYPIAEELCREAWHAEGKDEAFRPDDIRFLSDRQFAYAAAVIGIMHRERVASNYYFGLFYAESLLLAESGQETGAVQVAGTPSTTQIPFFLVACDYTIIGDEYFAATAYLTREPTLLGSLIGQDVAKALLFLMIIAGIAGATVTTLLGPKVFERFGDFVIRLFG